MLLQDAHSMAEEGKRAALPGRYSGLEVDGPPSSLPAGQHPPTIISALQQRMPGACLQIVILSVPFS